VSFINKKERVIQIELTQFGKKLLSKGNFKPQFYQFFDDDIIYDNEYGGTEDAINGAQDRIKDAIRLEPQYLRSGIETRFDQESKEIEMGVKDIFQQLRQSQNANEERKLLAFPLGTMNLATQEIPMFKLRSYDTPIKNEEIAYLTQSGEHAKIPQIDLNPTYSLNIDTTQATGDLGQLYDSETFSVDFSQDKIEFLDGSFLETSPENVTISLEESSVKYTKENFEIEIYEVLQGGDLVRIDEIEKILKYFDIKTDGSVAEVPMRKKINTNFFSPQE
tara:strand:- start:302 stop:1132 length:831 start_codon:yes stop_codon:yes gene_type:complete